MDFPEVLEELVRGLEGILAERPRAVVDFNHAGSDWLSIPLLSPPGLEFRANTNPSGELFPVAPAYQAYGTVPEEPGGGWL